MKRGRLRNIFIHSFLFSFLFVLRSSHLHCISFANQKLKVLMKWWVDVSVHESRLCPGQVRAAFTSSWPRPKRTGSPWTRAAACSPASRRWCTITAPAACLSPGQSTWRCSTPYLASTDSDLKTSYTFEAEIRGHNLKIMFLLSVQLQPSQMCYFFVALMFKMCSAAWFLFTYFTLMCSWCKTSRLLFCMWTSPAEMTKHFFFFWFKCELISECVISCAS